MAERWEPATSKVSTESSRPSALASTVELLRSAKGSVVEASITVLTELRDARSDSALREASTAMVSESSSQLQIERSPRAAFEDGFTQPMAAPIVLREMRRRGMQTPHDWMPPIVSQRPNL